MSLYYSTGYLKELNRSPRDIARRGDYFFQSVTFRDRTGECRHDRIVSQRSASGRGLKGIVHRANTHVVFPGIAPGPLPHLQGMNPDKVPEAFDFIAEKMKSP
jgi:hypothetical protein